MKQIKITLLSDTTVAATTASGGLVDTEVDHDPTTGLPRIGGKLLHGLLQDTWLSMKDYFPQYHDAAKRILGSEASHIDTAILHIGTAQPPIKTFIMNLLERPHTKLKPYNVLSALTSVRYQTSINRETGAANDGSLRSSRTVIRGLSFFAPLTWFDAPTENDQKLLEMCLKATRHLGLRRNRGRGYVKLELVDAVANTSQDNTPGGIENIEENTIVAYLPFRFTLRTPLLISKVGSDPNSVETQTYIPGSTFRGALAARLSQQDIAQYILGDKLAFLNAYPVVGNDTRALPSRRSWVEDKAQMYTGNTYHFNAIDLSYFQDTWPDDQVKRFHLEYTRPEGTSGYRVAKDLHLHHRRDRTRGRSTANAGDIFAYEAVQEGQTFQGLVKIRGENKTDIQNTAAFVKEKLSTAVSLGRSRRAEYGGLTQLAFGQLQNDEVTRSLTSVNQGQTFQCVLTSDYLGRSPQTGQIDPLAIEHELAWHLPDVRVLQRFYQFALAGGYNRTWKAELPQGRTLMAGSVLVLQAGQNYDTAILKTLVDAGLGERRQEGFGRFQLYQAASQHIFQSQAEMQFAIHQFVDDQQAVKEFQKRLVQQTLLQSLEGKVVAYLGSPSLRASSSLLGRLREALREGRLKEELEGLASKAKLALDQSSVKSQNLSSLLLALCDRSQQEGMLEKILAVSIVKSDIGIGRNTPVSLDLDRLSSQVCFSILDTLMKQSKPNPKQGGEV